MNRLWVRLSLMITAVLLFVFFLQFIAIFIDENAGFDQPPLLEGDTQVIDKRTEIARRLVNFMALSVGVGLAGGILISRIVVIPIDALVKAAKRIGNGDLEVTVKPRGSQEIRELAHSINQMATALQRAETLRNNLMADVSHELRTPLTILDGNLRAALDHVYTLDEVEIANLYEQNRHLIRLVNDLRELALAEANRLPMDKQLTDLKKLITDSIQTLEPMATEKAVAFSSQLDQLPNLYVDPFRLRQVIFNLLTNALRHTPSGGTITIKSQKQGDTIFISFIDTGDGLEKGELDVIFDRFYRGDKSRSRDTGGTGLGLAIVKAIMETHGGKVEVQSEGKGRGSTFTISLPVTSFLSTDHS